MWRKVERDLACVGVDAKYCTYTPELAAMKNLPSTGTDPETDLYFYHGDHLGSSSFITDASAYPTQHLQYLPFGEDYIHQQNSSNYYSPFTFSAKERDVETELSYFGARYYEAGLSIWLSVDPMAHKYPYQSNYTYCSNNPIMIYDPDGRDEFTIDKDGNVCFQKKSETHRLHTLENYTKGNLNDGVTVKDVKTLQQLEQSRSDFDIREIGGETFKGNYATSKNQSEMKRLFKFVSKNTEVEWTLELYKDGTNFLGTNHHSDMVGSGTGVKSLKLSALDLITDIHSHPGTSPKDDRASSLEGFSDMDRVIRITNLFFKHGRGYGELPKFYIYRPHVRKPNFFEYNAWTPRVN